MSALEAGTLVQWQIVEDASGRVRRSDVHAVSRTDVSGKIPMTWTRCGKLVHPSHWSGDAVDEADLRIRPCRTCLSDR